VRHKLSAVNQNGIGVWGGYINISARSDGGSRPPGLCESDGGDENVISLNCLELCL
jgi:hypothetical protein